MAASRLTQSLCFAVLSASQNADDDEEEEEDDDDDDDDDDDSVAALAVATAPPTVLSPSEVSDAASLAPLVISAAVPLSVSLLPPTPTPPPDANAAAATDPSVEEDLFASPVPSSNPNPLSLIAVLAATAALASARLGCDASRGSVRGWQSNRRRARCEVVSRDQQGC